MHTPLLCYILIKTLFYNSVSPNNYNRKCRTNFYKTAISARILSAFLSFLEIKRKKKAGFLGSGSHLLIWKRELKGIKMIHKMTKNKAKSKHFLRCFSYYPHFTSVSL